MVEIIKEKEEVDIFVCNDSGSECGNYDVKVNDGKIGVYVLEGSILNYENIKASSGVIYLVNNLKIIFKVLGSMIGTARETGDYSDLSNTVSGPIGIFLLIDIFNRVLQISLFNKGPFNFFGNNESFSYTSFDVESFHISDRKYIKKRFK